ncbi:hypothetical protein TIFTF001_017995 [Ficus carica]|uniref:Uncharacterized protein n=1 Tax=Ficus carica TaxID=3494 RepID=A0AA88AAP7_FICCA|nr:hypothetical protein TIFTF001_017995 [Ficus carica]
MHVREAEATDDTFKKCFVKCQDACKDEANGFTHCEVTCDTECSKKEEEAKLSQLH